MLPVAVIAVIAVLAFLLLITSAVLVYKLRPGRRRRGSTDEKSPKESRIPAVRRLVVRYGKVVTAPPSPAPHGSRMSRWPLSLSSSRRDSVTGGMVAEDYYGEETKSLKRDLEAQDEPYGNILYSIEEHPSLPYDPQTFWKTKKSAGRYSKSARIGTDSLIESSWNTYNAHRLSDDDLSSTIGPIPVGPNQEVLITVSNPSPPETSAPPPTREITSGKSATDSSQTDTDEPVVPSAKAMGKRPMHSKNRSIDYNALGAASVAAIPVSAFEPHSDTILPSQSGTSPHVLPSSGLPTLDEHATLQVAPKQPPTVVVSEAAVHELDAQVSQRPKSIAIPLSPTVNSISELDHIPIYIDTSDSASISTSTSRTPRPTSRPQSRSSNRSRSASRSNSSNSKSRNRVGKRPPPITTTHIPLYVPTWAQTGQRDNEQTSQATPTYSISASEVSEAVHSPTSTGALHSIPTSKFSPGLLSPDLGTTNYRQHTQPSRSNTVHTFASSEYNSTPLIAPVEIMPIYSDFAQRVHLKNQNSAKQKAKGLRKTHSESRSTQRTRESQSKDPESIVQPAALPTVRIEQPGWPPRGVRPLTMQSLDYEQIMSPTTMNALSHTTPASPSHIITQFQPLGPVSRFQIRPLGATSSNIPRRSRSRYSHLFDKPLPTPPPLSTPDSQEGEKRLQEQSRLSSHIPNKPIAPTAFPNFSRTRKLSHADPPPPRTPARTQTHPLPRPLSTYQRAYSNPTAPSAINTSAKQTSHGHKGRTRSVSEVSALSHAPARVRGNSIVSAISPAKTGTVLTRTTGMNGEWDDWRDSGVSPIESEFPTRSTTRTNWS